MKLKQIPLKLELSKKNQRILGEDYGYFLEKITLDLTEINQLIIQKWRGWSLVLKLGNQWL